MPPCLGNFSTTPSVFILAQTLAHFQNSNQKKRTGMRGVLSVILNLKSFVPVFLHPSHQSSHMQIRRWKWDITTHLRTWMSSAISHHLVFQVTHRSRLSPSPLQTGSAWAVCAVDQFLPTGYPQWAAGLCTSPDCPCGKLLQPDCFISSVKFFSCC